MFKSSLDVLGVSTSKSSLVVLELSIFKSSLTVLEFSILEPASFEPSTLPTLYTELDVSVSELEDPSLFSVSSHAAMPTDKQVQANTANKPLQIFVFIKRLQKEKCLILILPPFLSFVKGTRQTLSFHWIKKRRAHAVFSFLFLKAL